MKNWGRIDWGRTGLGQERLEIEEGYYETDYTKICHDFWSRGVVLEFSKMAVSLKWILDYFVGYTL